MNVALDQKHGLQAGMTEQKPAAAKRRATREDNEARIVCLFDPGDASGLKTKLSGLGYLVLTGDTCTVCKDALAVIINGATDPELELCRKLANKTPVILLAEEPDFSYRLRAARAGVEAVVGAPYDLVEVEAWLTGYRDQESQTFTILVADDDELAAETYAAVLEAESMTVTVETDPRNVPERIASVSPDLVLLDIDMPGASGLEVALIVRQTRRYMSLPILFLSAERDSKRQNLARRIGGDDFIAKPVNLDDLVTRVKLRAERAVALRDVMERDSLTGLVNHANFKIRLAGEVERSKRNGNPVSVALVDIDHFKSINDTHGHQIGDRVIQALAHALVGGLRQTDVVSRYGGEEFGVILLDTDAESAAAVLDKIRARVSQLEFEGENGLFTATFSAGVTSGTGERSADELIGAADRGLYVAKRSGRDRISIV